MFNFFNKKQDNKDNFTTAEDTQEQQYTLFEAIEKQDIDLVKKLIKNGVDINQQNKDGNSALIVAVMANNNLNNQHEIIKYLLENDADVYQKNNYNYNVLEIMRGKSHYDDIVKIFNKYGYDVQKPKENSNITSEKIEKNINVNNYKDGVRLIYYEILNENIDKVKYLLENNADLNLKNSDKYSAYKKLEWIKHYDKTSLELSIDKANLEIIKLLVDYCNTSINTLLCYAIQKNKFEIIKFLIKKSDDLNKGSIEHYNRTPLSYAVSQNNFEISELLLQNGANPNISGCLATACANQNLKMLKLLVEYKADANFAYYDGRNPLFSALEATKANKEIIRFLIENGADIHKKNNNGISPLSFAESNKVSLVKVLTEHEELKLSENQDPNIVASYQNILDKIVSQNKVINKLKDELETIKKSGINNETAEEYKAQIDNFKETLLSQSNEIKELQNKLIKKEEDTKDLINELISKINKLEEKIVKQKVIKTKIPLTIPAEKQSIKKDDGVIVKRDSFDDF